MRKFQQGGVSVFDPLTLPSPDVGTIDNSQEITPPTMQPVEMASLANLAQDADRRRREYEQERLRQQQRTDAAKKTFIELADGLTGPLHNEYQKAVIDSAKQKYQIPDNVMETMDLDNLQSLQQETNKLYRFWHDPEVLKVVGQVEAANKYMDKLPVNMTQEELDKYAEVKQAYESFTMDDYKQYGKDFDIRLLDGRMYQQKDASTTASGGSGTIRNLFTATKQMTGNGAYEIDWNDQAAVQEYADQIAAGWILSDPRAEDEGYVAYDDVGRPYATEKGVALAVAQGRQLNQVYNATRQDKLEDREAGKKIDSKYRAPSSSRGSGDPAVKAANDSAVLDGWGQIMAYEDLEQAFGDMAPFQYPALYDYILSLLPAISAKTGEPGGKQVITINSTTKDKIFETLLQLQANLRMQTTTDQPTTTAPAKSTFSSPTLTPKTQTQSAAVPRAGKNWVDDGKGNWIVK